MAVYQLFVKLLDGRTQCFQIPAPTISGESLKRHVSARTRIPRPFQRLVTGTRVVSDETLISASADGIYPSCVLLLRLPGGKGGFGSLLRGAATKAGQKKTNNFDACRDMSGRRLRHVNAEKKLEEWKSEAEDRRLEKLAEQFLKKKATENKKNSSVDVNKYLEKYREDSAKCMEEVEESVRHSFEVYKDLKRKFRPEFNTTSKRLKIWAGKNKVEESCSDDDDNDDDNSDEDDDDNEEKSVVLDDQKFPRNIKEDKGSSSMVSGSGVVSDEETSIGTSEQSNLDQDKGFMLRDGSSWNASAQSSLEKLHEKIEILFPAVDQTCINVENNFDSIGSSTVEVALPESVVLSDATSNVIKVPEKDVLKPGLHSEMESDLSDETVAHDTNNSNLEETLNFHWYNSAAELEVLGMDRLKAELQVRGLKCGGTLPERASRLYLLKSTPLDKLPKKLLARPPK